MVSDFVHDAQNVSEIYFGRPTRISYKVVTECRAQICAKHRFEAEIEKKQLRNRFSHTYAHVCACICVCRNKKDEKEEMFHEISKYWQTLTKI